ncbi:hypothetical protein SAMN04489735_100257 [Aneurinibacillus thermoaerophilus]|uniref:Uncharacterized protein n=1 Tax=Aneurinibacillus thermoaerophilus TaxID=143495 RepID=A0A1G7WQ31_ANETH|nr:hypothetical protein [Aneurinibacillus thermoaerophilus]SDG74061.1 hypothetical protein SAMN04489735_100257 [Aneurinibacillus thermoaerophilus]
MIGLGKAVVQIQEKVEEILKNENREGGRLEGVKDIISWVYHKGKPSHPAIWIIPQDPTPTTVALANKRYWEQIFSIASLVKSNDPVEGAKQATLLAGEARDILIQSKRLGLSYVQDVTDLSFSPSNNSNSNGIEYGAVAFIKVKFFTI